jgi:hypothetical protein
MMVYMLPLDGRVCGLGVMGFMSSGGILELRSFSLKTLLSLWIVAMVKFTLLHGNLIVRVFLGEYLLVWEGLHSSVVVMLVSFAINSLSDVLMACWLHCFTGNRSVDALIDLRGMAMAAGELGNSFFCGLHNCVLCGLVVGRIIEFGILCFVAWEDDERYLFLMSLQMCYKEASNIAVRHVRGDFVHLPCLKVNMKSSTVIVQGTSGRWLEQRVPTYTPWSLTRSCRRDQIWHGKVQPFYWQNYKCSGSAWETVEGFEIAICHGEEFHVERYKETGVGV